MSKKYGDTAELIKLVNLSLNNKANPNAFKTFMSGLSDEVKIKLFKYCLTSSSYFYLYLQYLRKIGSFEFEKNIPLIITLAQKCEGFIYARLLKFIIAYDKTALSMRDSNNNTVFHLICAKPHINPQLVKYFVEEVSRVKPGLLTDVNSHGETGVVLLAKNLLKFTNPDFNYCLQIQTIIQKHPRLLEMKEKKSSCLRTADILLACTVNIKEEKIGELQTLFELIDRYFLTQHNVSLLHMTLRTQHAINKLWLEKHSNTVVQDKKYVDLIDEKGRGLLAVAFEAKTIDVEIVTMLLKAGVDPDFESSPGKKPLWEFSKVHPELHALVKESYEKRDKPLPLNEEEKNTWIKMLILENKKLAEVARKTKPTMCDKETQTQDERLNYSLAV